MAAVRQIPSQIEKHGTAKASWLAFWRDADGRQRSRSFGAGERGRRAARRFAIETQARQTLAIRQDEPGSWREFRDEFELSITALAASSIDAISRALDHYERLIGPVTMADISARSLDAYIAQRQSDGISAASIGVELAWLRKTFRTAYRWHLIAEVPQVDPPRSVRREPSFISSEEFSRMFRCCEDQQLQTLIAFLYTTGWRIGATLDLRWKLISGCTVRSPAEHNKGRRDAVIEIPQPTADLLDRWRPSAGSVRVFDLCYQTAAYRFRQLQQRAGLQPQQTRGEWYGFHDLRRGFATANCSRLSAFELQHQMQHRSIRTTQKYIAMAAAQSVAIAGKVHLPDVLRDAVLRDA